MVASVLADIAMNPILHTYNLFKPDFKFETYLEVVKDGSYRHALTKFRTSSHTLGIERGRHTNTEVNERLFAYCEGIDDERHFILYCDVIDYERQCQFEKVNYHYPDLRDLDKFIYHWCQRIPKYWPGYQNSFTLAFRRNYDISENIIIIMTSTIICLLRVYIFPLYL